jgi:membrane-bound lytic murein transglycosylase D
MGEDLATIAHRFRTTEAALRELNDLTEADEVRPGFDLMVPAVPPREVRFESPPVVVVPARTFAYEGRRRIFYRVTRGDRLPEIARFFGVSVADVRQWNEVDPRATLQDGLFLQLFVPEHFDTSRAVVLTPDEVRILVMGSEEFYEHHVRQEGRVRLRYRVRAGDTLSTIANRFGISVGSVCRINVMPRDAVLAIGQELIVYTSPDRVPVELRGQIEPEPAPATETETPTASGTEPETEAEAEAETEAATAAEPPTETDHAR